jgi:hypothetical protein
LGLKPWVLGFASDHVWDLRPFGLQENITAQTCATTTQRPQNLCARLWCARAGDDNTIHRPKHQFSVTLVRLRGDVTDGEVDRVRGWFIIHGTRWYLGVEHGSVEFRRHMQCVLETEEFASAISVNRALKHVLGWDGIRNCRVCIKTLKQTGLHTFLGMVGYCSKDQYDNNPEKPFVSFHSGLSNEEFKRARDQYLHWGKPNKNRSELTPANLMDKATLFATVKMRGVRAPDFAKTVGTMLNTGQYFLSSQWAKPNSSLDPDAAALVWKARTNMGAFTGEDLGKVLFRQESYRYYREPSDLDLGFKPSLGFRV